MKLYCLPESELKAIMLGETSLNRTNVSCVLSCVAQRKTKNAQVEGVILEEDQGDMGLYGQRTLSKYIMCMR